MPPLFDHTTKKARPPEITLVFTTSSHWLSRVVRWVTNSDTSHVAIGAKVYGEDVLMHSGLDGETGQTGVQMTPRERWLNDNIIVAEYKIVPDVSGNMGSLIKLLCSRYDKLGLVGYALVIIAKWLGKQIMNPLSSPKMFVCARYVLELDKEGKLIPEWKGLQADQITPHDLLQLCAQGPSFTKIVDVVSE